MLWELSDGKHLYSLEAGNTVNALVFSPNRYWLCAATSSCIKSEFNCYRESLAELVADLYPSQSSTWRASRLSMSSSPSLSV
jgi:hypothetical protein